MTRNRFYFIALILLLPLTACEDESNDPVLMAEEERYFNLYMDANYPNLQPSDEGLYFIEFDEGEGASPDTGDWVIINYLTYTIPDESVVDTYDEQWARDYNLYQAGVLYGPYKYRHGTELAGMKLGVSQMNEGGIARLIFKSDLGYGGQSIGKIGAYTSLMYDIELVEVIDDIVEWEQQKISEYLAGVESYTVITDDEDTGAIMYYIPDEPGDSTLVGEEETVDLYYTGKLLDGRQFDSNTSGAGFKVTLGEEEVIRGWELGLLYFRYGGTGKLLIPHQLAYGEEGKLDGNSNKTAIPPYEPLLFDIEVLKTSSTDKRDI